MSSILDAHMLDEIKEIKSPKRRPDGRTISIN